VFLSTARPGYRHLGITSTSFLAQWLPCTEYIVRLEGTRQSALGYEDVCMMHDRARKPATGALINLVVGPNRHYQLTLACNLPKIGTSLTQTSQLQSWLQYQ